MKAPTITYPQSIVQSYITEPNILRESKEPRSEHVLKGLIEEIQEAPIPYPTDVINRLFAKDDLPALVNHASDLEQDSEVDDIIGGVSASDFFELEERATYAGFTVHKVKTDRSLFRAVALVVFESEDLYNDIINEVINYEFNHKSESCFNFDKLTHSDTAKVIQIIANIYCRRIQVRKTITNAGVNIVSPLNRWNTPLSEYQICLLEYSPSKYATLLPLSQKRSKVRIAEIPPEIIGDNDDSDIRNEIKKSFLEQQKWSTFDQKRHDLIIKGPGSINEESNELQDEEDITVNILECYSPKRSIPFDDLARRVLQSHHSPSLKRQKKQYKISNESSTGSQELRNIERATRESMEDFHISYSLKGSDSADSFDEGLRLALQISIEDTESLTKAQGKRPMK